MKSLAICAMLVGIFALTACDSSPAVAPTNTPADPIISATENAGTTNDSADMTLGDQAVTFTAEISDDSIDDFNVAGRFTCLAPVNPPTPADNDRAIPGSLQISGVDEAFRLVVVNVPFNPTLGTHEIEAVGGLGTYSVELTLDPRDPSMLYRSTSGSITLEALPTGEGDAVTGSFTAQLTPVSGSGDAISISGEFDFLADDTSTFCMPE